MTSYAEAVEALEGALVFGIHPSLDGITELVGALGDPQDRFASVQVTGTNGKTSTARLTAALLSSQGMHTGLYTSPHLNAYPERIEVDGVVIGDDAFARAVAVALEAADRLRPGAQETGAGFTEFELLTAAALWHFAEIGVDIAVLEVGLGGRWDATSVVAPSVAAITGVGLDHVGILGETPELIAAEKAAIIKPAAAPVLGPGTADTESVFLSAAEASGAHARAVREVGTPTPVAEELTIRFAIAEEPVGPAGRVVVEVRGVHATYPALAMTAPAYQAPNIATAVAVAEAALGRALDAAAAGDALSRARVPGRFEIVAEDPTVVVDSAHNPQAAVALAEAIRAAWPQAGARPVLLLGVLADKDARGIVAALAPVVSGFVATRSCSPRARGATSLAGTIAEVTGTAPLGVHDELGGALDHARAIGSPVVATGSVTTAACVREILIGRETRMG